MLAISGNRMSHFIRDDPTWPRPTEPLRAHPLRETTAADIIARASEAALGKRMVTNVLRAMLVEAMVAEALAADWQWCSADYAAWDFVSSDGIRLEVKQSAARQSCATEVSPPSECSFDIAARTGRYDGTDWVSGLGRYAHIYILAHHPIADISADHPHQWRFYVVATGVLPPGGRTISLARVQKLKIPAVSFEELAERVAAVKVSLWRAMWIDLLMLGCIAQTVSSQNDSGELAFRQPARPLSAPDCW